MLIVSVCTWLPRDCSFLINIHRCKVCYQCCLAIIEDLWWALIKDWCVVCHFWKETYPCGELNWWGTSQCKFSRLNRANLKFNPTSISVLTVCVEGYNIILIFWGLLARTFKTTIGHHVHCNDACTYGLLVLVMYFLMPTMIIGRDGMH